MKRVSLIPIAACLAGAVVLNVVLAGCSMGKAEPKVDPKDEAPPPAQVVPAGNSSVVTVDKPEQYPLVTAAKYEAAPELNVTGTVMPDVSRNIPVVTIASGRVLEIHAKLGDTVTKGDLLLKMQSADISGAFSDYRQAIADEKLAAAQLLRAKTLLEAGAMAQKDYEVAVDTDEKAKVTVETTIEHLRVLGVGQGSSDVDRRGFRAGFGRDHRSAGDAGRGHAGAGFAQSVYDLRHVARLGSLRRF